MRRHKVSGAKLVSNSNPYRWNMPSTVDRRRRHTSTNGEMCQVKSTSLCRSCHRQVYGAELQTSRLADDSMTSSCTFHCGLTTHLFGVDQVPQANIYQPRLTCQLTLNYTPFSLLLERLTMYDIGALWKKIEPSDSNKTWRRAILAK